MSERKRNQLSIDPESLDDAEPRSLLARCRVEMGRRAVSVTALIRRGMSSKQPRRESRCVGITIDDEIKETLTAADIALYEAFYSDDVDAPYKLVMDEDQRG